MMNDISTTAYSPDDLKAVSAFEKTTAKHEQELANIMKGVFTAQKKAALMILTASPFKRPKLKFFSVKGGDPYHDEHGRFTTGGSAEGEPAHPVEKPHADREGGAGQPARNGLEVLNNRMAAGLTTLHIDVRDAETVAAAKSAFVSLAKLPGGFASRTEVKRVIFGDSTMAKGYLGTYAEDNGDLRFSPTAAPPHMSLETWHITVAHEFAHSVWPGPGMLPWQGRFNQLFNDIMRNTPTRARELARSISSHPENMPELLRSHQEMTGRKPITAYAMTSLHEYFAETVAYFVHAPRRSGISMLLGGHGSDPEGHKLVEEMFKALETGRKGLPDQSSLPIQKHDVEGEARGEHGRWVRLAGSLHVPDMHLWTPSGGYDRLENHPILYDNNATRNRPSKAQIEAMIAKVPLEHVHWVIPESRKINAGVRQRGLIVQVNNFVTVHGHEAAAGLYDGNSDHIHIATLQERTTRSGDSYIVDTGMQNIGFHLHHEIAHRFDRITEITNTKHWQEIARNHFAQPMKDYLLDSYPRATLQQHGFKDGAIELFAQSYAYHILDAGYMHKIAHEIHSFMEDQVFFKD